MGRNPDDFQVQLNFLPLTKQSFSFDVYRTPKDTWERPDSLRGVVRSYNLPPGSNEDEKYESFWISFTAHEGWERYSCRALTNQYLTCEFLYREMLELAPSDEAHDLYNRPEDRVVRSRRVYFVLNSYAEGDQTIWMKPYYFRNRRLLGFLIDFHFRSNRTGSYRRTQELSLSTKNGRENRDFFVDRLERIKRFLASNPSKVLRVGGASQISDSMLPVSTRRLNSKRYVFQREETGTAAFAGMKRYGPLSGPRQIPKLLFIYRNEDIQLSRDLFRALRGDTFGTFLGLQRMLGISLDGTVRGAAVSSFSPQDLSAIITSDLNSENTVVVALTPFSKNGPPEDRTQYLKAKHFLLENRLPSQFVSTAIARDREKMKWSIANIALQLFAKSGGIPWRLQTGGESTLIVGLGQAHQIGEDRRIRRYFAYSVQTDSSGMYQDLRVLGASTRESDYLQDLRRSLKAIFDEYADRYDRFVIHTSFKIRRSEIAAIKSELEAFGSEKELILMKMNTDCQFFGYSKYSGSLVPYEGTWLEISPSEFLVWFDGLRHQDATAFKRFGGPAHVAFLYPEDLTRDDCIQYLQDAFNLSGANWRGFKGKTEPVSLLYARIIADFYRGFSELGLREIDLTAIRPWFL